MTPTLPKWTDAHSVSLFLAAIFSAVIGALGMLHVAIPAGTSAQVAGITGIAGTLIALAVNTYTHRSAHTAVATAQTYSPTPTAAIPPAAPPAA